MKQSIRAILPFSAAPLTAMLLLTSACGPATFDGEDDLLQLQVIHPDDTIMSTLGALLAEGTQVDMRARFKDGDLPARIQKVLANDKAIIEVTDFNPDRVTFTARKAGDTYAFLEVDGPADESISDTVPLKVRKVESTVITNPCKDGVLLTNGHVDMRYSMRDESDKRLTGYGFYPITIEPAGPTVDQDYKFVEHIRIQTGNTPGTFTTQSTLKTNDLEFDVIEPTDITTFIDTHHETNDDEFTVSLESGTTAVTTFEIKTDDHAVCGQSEHFNVKTRNPEVCTGELKSLGNIYFVNVSPLTEGTCTLEIQLVASDKTVLHNNQYTVSIAP